MRTFHFKARNIGDEKYLTYTMGEETELDEDVLDYCEENLPEELLPIIYEEDDDYDYLTYDITECVSLEEFTRQEVSCEQVLNILRNTAGSLISLKEQTIPLSYVLLNKRFIYIDTETHALRFICLPIESKGSLAAEFKNFVRQLLAHMRYNVEEELSYVGKLLTYINGDNFNLRGLIGLSEALMEEEGMSFEKAGSIETDEGIVEESEHEDNLADFMKAADKADEPLPEIGDDEEEEEEEEVASAEDGDLDSILPAQFAQAAAAKEIPEEEEEAPADFSADVAVTEEIPVVKAPKILKPEDTAATEVPTIEEASEEDKQKNEEEKKAVKAAEVATQAKLAAEAEAQKAKDIDIIKQKMRELAGNAPAAAAPAPAPKKEEKPAPIRTEEELDDFLVSRPPSIKRKPVKVNRAAMIQSMAAEVEAEEAAAAAEAAEAAAAAQAAIEAASEAIKEEKAAEAAPAEETAETEADTKEKKTRAEKRAEKKAKAEAEATEAEETEGEEQQETAEESNPILSAVSKTLAAKASLPKALPYLIRVSTKERIMLSKTTFRIGKASRGVDYTVTGNGAISRQHAVIIQRDGQCYLKDNKSTNHTFLNDKMLEDGAEELLKNDMMIRLGDEEFRFKAN